MFKFKVNFYDEDNFESKEEVGITTGKTYGEACNKIVKFYGEGNIMDVTIESIDDILIEEEVIEMLKR